ncbi:PPC domain-containing protein [Archangium violaceum]|uniref:PPC domain-containing protein n=1 Tax=Archangium violaceum TaxID=83451 RepID=UPI00194E5A5C|nr:PPC domain-containing protein [Archangium violaceum]QRN95550.1 PPC domain-containing protein [Archangium violaceum]
MNSISKKMMYAACFALAAACGPDALSGAEVPELAPKPDLAALRQPLAGDCTTTYSLTKDVAKTNLSGTVGSWSCIYKLTVPSGAAGLAFKTSGGTGDADLYVRYGLTPDATSYDCHSLSTTNEDQCLIASPQAGTYYVRLYGYGDYTGASLTGTYGVSCTSTTIMDVGRTYSNINAPQGLFSCGYLLTVPSGVNSVTFTTSGGTGNADLYVRRSDWPRADTYDCRSTGYSNSETCTLYYPSAGTYYIKLYGTSASSGVQLLATLDRPYTASVLVRGQPYVDVSMSAGEQRRYEIDMPWGKSDVQFFTSGGTGNANLYVKYEQAPTPYSHDCRNENYGNDASCLMGWGKTGRYYVLVEAKEVPVTGLRIGVSYTDYYN